jgi:hypothetical protein
MVKIRTGIPVVLTLMAACIGSLHVVAQQQHLRPVAATSTFQGFNVKLTLSDKARRTLIESKETIIVAAYFTGNPKQGALKRYVNKMGEINVEEIKVEIKPGDVASFGEIKLKKDVLEQIDNQGPQLLINVYSGRKSSEYNLLDCGIYQGDFKPVQGESIPISCKLIRE